MTHISPSVITPTPVHVNDVVILKNIWSICDSHWVNREDYIDDLYVVKEVRVGMVALLPLSHACDEENSALLFTHVELCKL